MQVENTPILDAVELFEFVEVVAQGTAADAGCGLSCS